MSETVKIILGYVLSFAWIAVALAAGELLNRAFKVEKELSRKISHLISAANWIICAVFTGPTYHTVIINAIALVLITVAVFGGKIKYFERADAGRSYGLVYYCLSTLIVMCITVFAYPRLFPATGIAYYCLALGDGLAPIAARIAGKRNIKVFGNKSLVGAIAVFVVSALTAWTFSAIYKLGFDALDVISVGAISCVAELIGAKGTDNLLVDFFVFAYCAMIIYGVAPQSLEVTAIVAAPLFMFDSVSATLTPAANIMLWLYLLLSVYCMGYVFLVASFVLFGAEAAVARVTNKKLKSKDPDAEDDNADEQKHGRNARQIFANMAVALLFTVLYKIFGVGALMFVAFAVLVEEFADSIASDIGRLAKNPPRDILGFKRLKPGISGGISLLGTTAAVLFAAAGAALPFIFVPFDYRAYLVVAGVAALGTLIDSVLGSALQALYTCDVCGQSIEKPIHCGQSAQLVKGLRIVNNSTVNLLSAVFCAAIAVALFWGAII